MQEQSQHDKIQAEIAKLIAETARINRETIKISRETFWYPMVVVAGLFGAIALVIKHLF